MINYIAFEKNNTRKIIRPLTDDEINTIDQAGKMLSKIRYFDNLYILALFEWEELIELVKKYSEKTNEGISYDIYEFYLRVNNKLGNYLSNARKFIDQSEMKIYQEYGKETSVAELWDLKKRELYDGYLSYRFLYHLRHFTQHNGSLLLNQFTKKIVPTQTGEDRLLEIRVLRNSLLDTSFNWNSKLKGEIEKLPENINIMKYIIEHKYCLKALYCKIIEIIAKEVSESFREYTNLINSFYIDGNPCIFKFKNEESLRYEKNYKNNFNRLPLQEIYKYLEKMAETGAIKLNYYKGK
ncbi:hypothetical protein K8O68_09480 [Salipaludibacillus sp. CUR1]|uniref:hypothetical protein n=1 Tax=Salipaludibacillus sp. CUR1 TaxID=2820003 RepID=UPI001E58C92C|nr:hypothetical protein [Salipaludibacillus sp. CUR1]MCE7792645.1 hypothetical protein [Salipaludibacillus sp. CUR1]